MSGSAEMQLALAKVQPLLAPAFKLRRLRLREVDSTRTCDVVFRPLRMGFFEVWVDIDFPSVSDLIYPFWVERYPRRSEFFIISSCVYRFTDGVPELSTSKSHEVIEAALVRLWPGSIGAFLDRFRDVEQVYSEANRAHEDIVDAFPTVGLRAAVGVASAWLSHPERVADTAAGWRAFLNEKHPVSAPDFERLVRAVIPSNR